MAPSCRTTRTMLPFSRLTIDVDDVASMAERRVLVAHRSRRPGGRRSHDDVGRRRLRQPRRARRADPHGDHVVPRRGRHARQLRPVLPDPEPRPGGGRGRDRLPAPGAADADRPPLRGRPEQPPDHPGRRRARPGRDRRLGGDPHRPTRCRSSSSGRCTSRGRTSLRGRPRERRRHRAADAVVPRRGRDRVVLQHVHPARQPEHRRRRPCRSTTC